MKHPVSFLCCCLLFFLLFQSSSFAQEKKWKAVCIAFYNLENLFDTIDDPQINELDFTPGGSARWDSKKYLTKLNNMAWVIGQIGKELVKDGPVIVGLSEVENKKVVEDLINTPPLKNMGYRVVHYDSPDKRGIDVALIYQSKYFKDVEGTAIPFTIPGRDDFFTRDILMVTGKIEGEPITILVNHWPSRSSGTRETAPLRNAAADLCFKTVNEITGKNQEAKILIMGDLNDDPVDESLVKHLKAKSKLENVKPGDLFNPMWAIYKDGIGSLAYRDSWNLFDQIIISSSLVDKNQNGYSFYRAKVFSNKELLQKEGQYTGYPFRTYAGGVYTGGYSDHLPVYLFLVKPIN